MASATTPNDSYHSGAGRRAVGATARAEPELLAQVGLFADLSDGEKCSDMGKGYS